MKPSILYYSDCSFFAGCENMIANLLNSDELNNDYELYFMYRDTAIYSKGLSERVTSSRATYIPIKLPPEAIHRLILKYLKQKSVAYNILSAIIIPPWKYISIVLYFRIIFKQLKKINPDILHINNGGFPAASSCYSMVLAAKLLRVKIIIYVVNNIAQDYHHPIRWFDYYLDIIIKKSVSNFITGSKYAASRLASVLNLPSHQVKNIPNGISAREVTQSKYTFLNSMNIKQGNRLIFSTIAILEKRKGHFYLLEAIRLLMEKTITDKMPLFIIEGSGPEKEFLVDFVDKNELTPFVFFAGDITNIFNLYNASDVIVLPSISNEDFPNVVIEAMGMGKPVVGTNIAGIPEQIDHNVNGFCVPAKNSIELARAIELLNNCDKVKAFGLNAKQKYLNEYTAMVSVNRYFSIYNEG